MVDGLRFDVKMSRVFLEPYYDGDPNKLIEFSSDETYRGMDMETADKVIREFVDAPEKPMTDKMVTQDFFDLEVNGQPTERSIKGGFAPTKEKVTRIKNYYNFRYKLLATIQADINKAVKDEKLIVKLLSYDIPQSAETFTTMDDNEHDKNTHLISSRLEIVLKRV